MDDTTFEFPLRFARTAPYPCAYLSDRQARSLVAIPAEGIDAPLYDLLIRAGFRRSGDLVYQPDCPDCQDCIPARLRVDRLQTDRSQRRALKRHAGLQAIEMAPIYSEEHYALYRRYQRARHRGGGMDDDNREQFKRFLLHSQVDSRLVEFREDGELRMVSLIDLVADGLSSVYCFFDPDLAHASFGTYNILWQADCCRRLGLPWLYLGYWIADCPKMAYKAHFQPLELLMDGQWQAFPSGFPGKWE